MTAAWRLDLGLQPLAIPKQRFKHRGTDQPFELIRLTFTDSKRLFRRSRIGIVAVLGAPIFKAARILPFRRPRAVRIDFARRAHGVFIHQAAALNADERAFIILVATTRPKPTRRRSEATAASAATRRLRLRLGLRKIHADASERQQDHDSNFSAGVHQCVIA